MKKVQEYCFLSVGFLLGSIGILYGKTFHYCLLVMVLFYICTNWNSFIEQLKQGKGYILVFAFYLVYISLQTGMLFFYTEMGDKPHYGIFENILLNFILVPIYTLTLKGKLTPKLLKRFLLLFCLGCVLLNAYIAFDLVMKGNITGARAAIEFLYTSRFGENKMFFLGGNLLLEPQAFNIALAALISYVMIYVCRHRGMKIACGVMFIFLSIFLSFTVTKAGLLAFLAGFVLMNIYILKQRLWRIRLMLLIGIFLLISGVFVFDGFREKYKERADEIVVELQNVKHGVYAGGTIAPRVGFVREAYMHIDEFGLWGLGVFAKNRIKEWLQNSDAGLGEYVNVHNTFLHYWIQGGILGLGVVIFLFGAPFYVMVKNKKKSYFITSMIVLLIIANSTCILLDLNNSRLIIVLMLSVFYFYNDIWKRLEESIAG